MAGSGGGVSGGGWIYRWTEETASNREEEREVYIGWPEEGGVLFLHNSKISIPGEVGMLRIATSMEERCRLLRDRLDAMYYKNTRTYPGLAVLGPKKIESKKMDERLAKGGESLLNLM